MSERIDPKKIEDALRAFAKATEDLPPDTEVSQIGPDGSLELLPDLAEKVKATRRARAELQRIAAAKKPKDRI